VSMFNKHSNNDNMDTTAHTNGVLLGDSWKEADEAFVALLVLAPCLLLVAESNTDTEQSKH